MLNSRRSPQVAGLLTALLAGGLLGCESPGRVAPAQLTAPQRIELERRARDLLLRAVQSELDVVAAHAMEALVDVAPRDALVFFRQRIDDDSPLVRYAALISLGRVKDTAWRQRFVKAMQDRDPHVRLAAAYAAIRAGAASDIYPKLLTYTLQHALDEDLRAEAAYLLGQLGDPRAQRRLKWAAQEDASNKVVVHAQAALALLGDKDALDRLIAYTQGDRLSRSVALQTLIELNDPRTREAYLDRLGPREEFIVLKLLAARGLGKLGSAEGLPLALEVADPTYVPAAEINETELMKLRVNAALALGAIGEQRALPVLRELASSDDPRIQVAACWAILQISAQNPLTPAR